METRIKQMDIQKIPPSIPLVDQLQKQREKLKEIRRRFEDNYPRFSSRKYEQKRKLYILLTRTQSKLNQLTFKNFESSKALASKLNGLHSDIQGLEKLKNSLYPK